MIPGPGRTIIVHTSQKEPIRCLQMFVLSGKRWFLLPQELLYFGCNTILAYGMIVFNIVNPDSQGFAVRLTVFDRISRSHGLTLKSHGFPPRIAILMKCSPNSILSLIFVSASRQFERWTLVKGLRGNSPWGEAEWAIDPWPLRAKGLIVLVSPN